MVDYEITKRFPENFTFIGVENAKNMNKLTSYYYHKINIYDQLIEDSIPDFLVQNSDKYDVISC